MKKLTLRPQMGDSSIKLIEDIVNQKFDDVFQNFIKMYAGLSHNEYIFMDESKTVWHVQQYNNFDNLFGLTKEFLEGYKRKLIPFAYDPGGWHFCLCMDEGVDFGSIIVNRWTDHLPEDQFLRIADSFEEFINGLMTEEEAIKLGY